LGIPWEPSPFAYRSSEFQAVVSFVALETEFLLSETDFLMSDS
jgi:hypothetical protein